MSAPARPETQWEIAWRQFQQNRTAVWSLRLLVVLSGLAILAPCLASNLPFIYFSEGETLFPWFRALFHPETPVDFAFNMALLSLPVTLLYAAVAWRSWRRRQLSGRLRSWRTLRVLLALTLFLTAALGPSGLQVQLGRGRELFRVPEYGPRNAYQQRNFQREQLDTKGRRWGLYPLLQFGPTEQDSAAYFRPPGFRVPRKAWKEANDGQRHWLGTDNVGRDVLVRMLYGLRIALTVGLVAVSIYLSIGTILGALAGYFGGWVDSLISRTIEVVLLFPSFFLILTLVGLIGPSIYMIMFVIGITGWPTVARLIRGEVLRQRAQDYTVAARALGASHWRVLFRHVLPNALAPVFVAAPFGIAGAITTESGLSLLGFGVQPPAPTWGGLLALARTNFNYWWLIVFPSLAIFLAVTVLNLVGFGLRDATDPRLRGSR